MAQLTTKISLYCKAKGKSDIDFAKDVFLQDDGEGAYIKEWNVSGVDKPSDADLSSYETDGNTEEALNEILNNRKNAYPSIADQLDDIYWNGIDGWKTTIKAVKDKYPKG